MSLNKLPDWLQADFTTLASRVFSRNLLQTVLLSHAKGSGELVFINALSALLLCQSPAETDACGQCHACHLFLAGNHPDYFHLAPEGKSQTIKIDAVRDVIAATMQRPQISVRQLVIIEAAECLNTAAANALLKSLEEPTESTQFILLSSKPSRLLPTILSRSMLFRLQVPSREAAEAYLQEAGFPANQVCLALDCANGAPFLALDLLSAPEQLTHFETMKKAWQSLVAGKLRYLAFLDETASIPDEEKPLLLQRLVIVSIAEKAALGIGADYWDYLNWLNNELRKQEKITGLNSGLFFESAVLRWCRLTQS